MVEVYKCKLAGIAGIRRKIYNLFVITRHGPVGQAGIGKSCQCPVERPGTRHCDEPLELNLEKLNGSALDRDDWAGPKTVPSHGFVGFFRGGLGADSDLLRGIALAHGDPGFFGR